MMDNRLGKACEITAQAIRDFIEAYNKLMGKTFVHKSKYHK
jgi:hypothetical protein